MSKVSLYCRVSSAEQTNENQKIRLLQYATQNNLSFDLFEETESTRKTRPVKQELMQRLRKHEYTAVIVFKLDRWARSFTELILEIEEFTKKKIGFISISDNLDFSTAVGQLQFQILAAFSQFERALISERTKEGLYRAKKQGKRLGRPQGSKDTRQRAKSGYIMREARKRKLLDEKAGKFMPVENYIK